MTRPFFVDTSAWCAVYDKADSNHSQAMAYWQAITATIGTLYTSDYVLDETITLLRMRVGHQAAVEFGRLMLASEVVSVLPVSRSRWQKAWELFCRYQDKTFSFTDCTSIALMTELGLTEALAFDRHFQQAGFSTRPV